MDLIQHVYYINLDHRTDRREQIESELKRFNLPFTRIPAIKHKFGLLGCNKSHLIAITKAIEAGYERILICEDDMMWTVLKEELDSLLTQFKEKIPSWDVLMLAINKIETVPTEFEGIEKVIEGTTTAAYLINKSWMPIWKRLLETVTPKLEKELNHRYVLDQCWRGIQGGYGFYCFKKQVAKQRDGYSDCCEGYVKYDC
jgi:GR25 family glycosyltransferase involved in LPS biosynthesis